MTLFPQWGATRCVWRPALVLSAAVAAQPALHAADSAQPAPASDSEVREFAPYKVVGQREAGQSATQTLTAPGLTATIDRAALDGINAINVEDSLRYAPNLVVRKRYIGDNNATLSFRNMHTTQTPRAVVLVDGFNISNFLGASFDTAPKWAVLGPQDVDSAQLMYGPTSARYSGHSLGGALILNTHAIESEGGRASAQLIRSDYDYYATDLTLDGYSVDVGSQWVLGGGSPRGGLSLAYRHFENEGQPQQWRRVGAGTQFADQAIVDRGLGFPLRIASEDSVVDLQEDQVRLRGHYQFGAWSARTLVGLLKDREDTSNPRSFLRDDNGNETFIGISGVSQGLRDRTELLAGVGAAGQVGTWTVDVALSRFDVLKDDEQDSDNFDTDTGEAPISGRVADGSDAGWTALEVVSERYVGMHGLALGLSVADYSFEQRTFTSPNWLRGVRGDLRDASGGRTSLLGLFVEDRWQLAQRWTATLGLRAEAWQAEDGFLFDGDTRVDYARRDESALSPKLALEFVPTAHWTLTASAALATRFPTVRELYQVDLIAFGPNVGELDLNGFDPNLEPERGQDFQLIAKREFGASSVTLSMFRQVVDDTLFSQSLLIPSPSDPSSFEQESLTTNIDEVTTDGVDLIVALREWGVPGLAVDANVAWLDAEVTENRLNPALAGNQFPRVPEWRANANLRWSPTPAWLLAAGWRYQSTPDRNIENSSNSQCDTFFCVTRFSFVDLRATRRLGAVDVSVGIDNLTDERAFVFHPYPGRTGVVELSWPARER